MGKFLSAQKINTANKVYKPTALKTGISAKKDGGGLPDTLLFRIGKWGGHYYVYLEGGQAIAKLRIKGISGTTGLLLPWSGAALPEVMKGQEQV